MMASNKDIFEAVTVTSGFIGAWYYGALTHDGKVMIFSLILFVTILYMSYLRSKEKKRLKKYQKGTAEIAEQLSHDS